MLSRPEVSKPDAVDEFSRLHRIFVFHLGIAVGLAWMTSLYAALFAPWVRNIRPLIEAIPSGRIESTGAFLFGMPAILTVAWVVLFFGRDLLRHVRVVPNQLIEFAFAAVAAFVLFYLSIDRAVAAILLGSA